MTAYRNIFPGKAFLPVVHVSGESQARRNVDIARQNGADGVFLIDHRANGPSVVGVYAGVRSDHPGWWIGLNRLDLSSLEAIRAVPKDASGVWTDNIAVSVGNTLAECNMMLSAYNESRRERRRWQGLHFGGTAFKYQTPVRDDELAIVCKMAVCLTDVITTSGDKTGSAPNTEKIRIILEAVGDFPIAVASGISADNARDFLPYVDAFLVASSISRDFHSLDGGKVRQLADIIHSG